MDLFHLTPLPNGLPTLAGGGHLEQSGKACVMEYVSMIAGEAWSDAPPCTDRVLASAARTVNDLMIRVENRSRLLLPLVPDLIGTSSDVRRSGSGAGAYFRAIRSIYLGMRSEFRDAFPTDVEVFFSVEAYLINEGPRNVDYLFSEIKPNPDDCTCGCTFHILPGREDAHDEELARYLTRLIHHHKVAMQDIGKPVRRIEVVPEPLPEHAPVKEPSPERETVPV